MYSLYLSEATKFDVNALKTETLNPIQKLISDVDEPIVRVTIQRYLYLDAHRYINITKSNQN